ncbi:MarR family winged helix-turn-helix transcriptional regulator [Herbiconiux sp. CPCC 203407]|uniref:MarR family winged helix-turn-helix transcriptional regulator n=1 Tax=Herbiconiux oxytropis TaxID=2970915 RepID=A0AA41XKH7_9MICO|nr:MarR family winged helix-turn-helix transcriptional regulator [Herbiconiux oxytropis]MCS5723679.1 MarR family winged helix-turn-helix transcriptional regulator [Herbiconiux oxytropis]MCS5728088.1 MarR family winged helix-turn-helix transcriptional regulator [Herbiconiux oxytropis]
MSETHEDAPQKRSPNAAELAVWRTYIETAEEVRRTLASAFQETSGISPGDYSVMLALSEAPGRTLRSSDVATVMGWERSRLSHHIRRMEERGLVLRGPVGGDARGAAVSLTEVGARTFRSSSAAHLRLVREVFVDAFTPEQLATLHALTTALRTHLDTDD